MKEKLVIRSDLLRKQSDFNVHRCVVEKALPVSHEDFLQLKNYPMRDNELIAENVDLMYCDSENNLHCLLIFDKEQGDGLLIESEGYSYARYAQYIPQAKLIYEDFSRSQMQEIQQETAVENPPVVRGLIKKLSDIAEKILEDLGSDIRDFALTKCFQMKNFAVKLSEVLRKCLKIVRRLIMCR